MTTSASADQVRAAARALMEGIVAEVATWKKSNRLVLRKRRYTLRPNFSLHYTVDPAIMNFEVEEQEEDSWDDENWESFWTDRI